MLSRNLKINGTSGISKTTWKIYWDNIEVASGSVNGEKVVKAASITGDKDQMVEYIINLTTPGDFYEFSVDAVNDSTLDAMVDEVNNNVYEEDGITPRELPSYLEYTVLYDDGSSIELDNSLPAGSS